MFKRTIFREIRTSLGRYIAILAIVALGVGFFSGLKVTREAMISTTEEYLDKQNFYDYEFINTLGFEETDVKSLAKAMDTDLAEGVISYDALCTDTDGSDYVLKAMSVTSTVNKPHLSAGRMPKKANECLADNRAFSKDEIGSVITISRHNNSDTTSKFSYKKYTIVGLGQSPLYLNFERGSTSLGSGSLTGFFYIPAAGFTTEEYTQVYVRLPHTPDMYSSEYDDLIKDTKKQAKAACKEAAERRYTDVVKQAVGLGSSAASATMLPSPKTYTLTRNENIGYVCFESDSKIVEGVARVFPIFFFLVAALVCMTTMTRMIDEQRTQIGVLRALGFSNATILGKYLFYSGSAALTGAIVGFLGGCYLFPAVIWKAYGMMYDFSGNINYTLNPLLAVLSLIVAILCSMGATMVACGSDFRKVPAQLIRPKAPKNGKRILLERITPLWRKISFLYKVTLRNIFRYKGRFLMMILGISGCTALLVTGLGINDSIKNIAQLQFDTITVYDYSINFNDRQSPQAQQVFQEKNDKWIKEITFVHQGSCDMITGNTKKNVQLIVAHEDELSGFINLKHKGKTLDYPKKNQAIICEKLADQKDLKIGDTITLQDSKMNKVKVKISSICDNYVYNYVYTTPETCRDGWGYIPDYKTALVFAPKSNEDTIHQSASHVMGQKDVAGTSVNIDMRKRVKNMMHSLNAVIWLVCLSAGALAFIVSYNLTNINITERTREIATIKVLGFYPMETSSYVFRENFLLTGISAVVGLFLGKILHAFVMSQINVDMVSFDKQIATMSYIFAFVLTFVFAILVNIVMFFKIRKISMTESLKSIE